jgi:hypothetical protein
MIFASLLSFLNIQSQFDAAETLLVTGGGVGGQAGRSGGRGGGLGGASRAAL